MSWDGETIQLCTEVTEQLRQNYLVSRGIHSSSHIAINKNSLSPQRDSREDSGNIQRLMPDAGGGTDTNREWELNGNMDMSVDDETSFVHLLNEFHLYEFR